MGVDVMGEAERQTKNSADVGNTWLSVVLN